jgi:hypothetical protein
LYFRFFVGEEDFCKTVQVLASVEYGYVYLAVSNVYAYPSIYYYGGNEVITNYRFNSAVFLCPNENEYYERGTYAIAVTSWSAAAFSLSVNVSAQKLPLPPAPTQISCDDVPPSEFHATSVCIPEGVTTQLNFNVRHSCDNLRIASQS